MNDDEYIEELGKVIKELFSAAFKSAKKGHPTSARFFLMEASESYRKIKELREG